MSEMAQNSQQASPNGELNTAAREILFLMATKFSLLHRVGPVKSACVPGRVPVGAQDWNGYGFDLSSCPVTSSCSA